MAWEDLVKEVARDRKLTVLSFLKDLKQIYGYYIDFHLYWIGGRLREAVVYERSWRFDCKKLRKHTLVTMDNPIRYQTMQTQAMKISLR